MSRSFTRWLNQILGFKPLRGSHPEQFLNAHRRYPVRWV